MDDLKVMTKCKEWLDKLPNQRAKVRVTEWLHARVLDEPETSAAVDSRQTTIPGVDAEDR